MPLQPLPLASQSYELASRPAAQARLLNMAPEKLPEGSRSPFILKPTAGLTPFVDIGPGPILAMATIPGSLFVISGTSVFRLRADDSPPVFLGSISPSSRPSIALSDSQVVICSPPNAYVTDYGTDTLRQVTTGSGNFPAEGASSVAYIDGYFVFTVFNGTYFFVSKLLTGLNFDSLDFARSARRPDFIQHAVTHNGELWFFGTRSSSVWYNSGSADFPFRERSGSTLRSGIGSSRTVCEMDGSLWWLGNDGIVYRSQGYQAKRVSTHALEELLQQYPDFADTMAAAFFWEGHAYYALSLPFIGRTFVYDASVDLWHERSSGGGGRWNVNTSIYFDTRVLMGSAVGGQLFDMDRDLGTDNGVPIARLAVLPAIVTHGPRAFMSRLEVEMEVGTSRAPASVTLDWSDDGGLNWTDPRTLGAGALGETRTRVVATRLGSFRQRALRLQCGGPLTVYGVDADIAKGDA